MEQTGKEGAGQNVNGWKRVGKVETNISGWFD